MKILKMLFCILCCVMIAAQVNAKTMYSVIELPIFSRSMYVDINNNGKVVGLCQDLQNICVWDPVNGVENLVISRFTGVNRLSINDSGQIAGTGYVHEDYRDVYSFIYDATSGVTDFNSLVGQWERAYITRINDLGQVVGHADSPGSGGQHPFFWDATQGMVNLDPPGEDFLSTPHDINNSGQVVGWIEQARDGGVNFFFLWDATHGTRDLATLGCPDCYPQAINDAGQVVGTSGGHAFLWDTTDGIRDLGALDDYSVATGINDDGQVVGNSGSSAFIWDATNGMVDLNMLVLSKPAPYSFREAHAINRDGKILVSGGISGVWPLYLLTPEPDYSGGIDVGEVTITHQPVRVDLSNPFIDPVVVARMVTKNGGDPCVLRISNVDRWGFTIQLQEYEYLNGPHTREMVSYLVMERGTHILDDGTLIEAGTFATTSNPSPELHQLEGSFSTPPVIMTSVTTVNGSQAVTGRLESITTTGFEYHLQEQEAANQSHWPETISYIAWQPGGGKEDNLRYEVGTSANVMNHRPHSLEYMDAFASTPIVLADMQTTNGTDTAALAVRNSTATGLEIFVEEETSKDQETSHVTESAGYIALIEDQESSGSQD